MENDFEICEGELLRYKGMDEEVILPDTITKIGTNAFAGSKCKTLIISKTVVSLGESAFLERDKIRKFIVDKDNPEFSSEEDMLYNKDRTILLKCPQHKRGKIIFSAMIKEIDRCAFFYCRDESNLKIPDTVKIVGDYAFVKARFSNIVFGKKTLIIGRAACCGCDNLKSVFIPENVENISRLTFMQCGELSQINVAKENRYYYAKDNVLYDRKNLRVVCCAILNEGKVTIDGAMKTICESAFSNCCISEVKIDEGVKEIGERAFAFCYSLEKIKIPDSVESIGYKAFCMCLSLKKIHIPKGVTFIDDNAFQLSNLSLTVSKNNKTFCASKNILYNKAKTVIISCLNKRKKNLIVEDGITDILYSAFQDCKFVSIFLPKSVSKIDKHDFSSCSNLEKIIVDPENKNYSSVDGVLYDKTQTTLIYVPTKINKEFTVPDGVKIIEPKAFADSYISTVTLPDSVIKIGQDAFPSYIKLIVSERMFAGRTQYELEK